MYERSFFPQPSLKSTVEDILTALVFTSLQKRPTAVSKEMLKTV
jgi:hypothetical protein